MTKKHAAFSPKEVVVNAVKAGVPVKYAAATAGVTAQTVYAWRKEDPAFAVALASAQAEPIVESISIVRGSGEWKAHQWFLQTRARSEFGTTDRNAPVTETQDDSDLPELTDAEIEAALAAEGEP